MASDASAEVIQATIKLHEVVTRAFNDNAEYPRTLFNERERYAAAVQAVGHFLSSIAGRGLGDRFFELGSAIADLNSGTVRSLLQPVKVDNRQSDNSQLWRARARVSVGFAALLKSGLSRSEAITKISRGFPAIAKLAGRNAKDSTLQTIVRGWHKRLKAGRVKNFEADELFSEGIRRIDAITDQQRLVEFAMRQIAEAAGVARALSPPLNTRCFELRFHLIRPVRLTEWK
jgi:hypothetical protein